MFQTKVVQIKFSCEKISGRTSLSPGVQLRGIKYLLFLKYNVLEWEWQIFWSSLAPLLGEMEIRVYRVFCRKFNFIQFLFEAFFDNIGTFGSVQL